ncbi:MAG: RDD family protein [Sulfurimonas sp.]|nr:RDD family protein [Sulfurimonas sp.]MBU3939554.1 RDD family protein [bacterium]MBU4024817.1 RDD family protein [bacterium]MBU4059930.1 RDD family protein [bacterium]MBU4109529.1 RDD family protein [bacterium]
MRFRNLKKITKNNQKISEQNKTKSNALLPKYTDRIKAFITDMFMIYIPILYIIAYVALSGKDEFQASSLAQFSGVAIYATIYALFLSKTGQTPGKKAYGIKVVDAKSEDNLSFLQAMWRFVSFLISATTLIGLLLPLYRKDKKSLHDIMSSSKVIVL